MNPWFLLLSFVSLLLNLSVNAQFDQFTKGRYHGIKYNSTQITKAKFDSCLFLDDSIATAYKKTNVFYFNVEGDRIYKSKTDRAEPFSSGTAIIKKKAFYGAINRDGKVILNFSSTDKPVKMGIMLVCKENGQPNQYIIYGRNHAVAYGIDSVELVNGWLIGHDKWKEQYTYYKKKLFGKDELHYGYHDRFSYAIFQADNSRLIDRRAKDFYLQQDFLCFSNHNDSMIVYNPEKEKIIAEKLQHVWIMDDVIYGFKDTINAQNNLVIFDRKGNRLADGLGYIGSYNDDYNFFSKDSMQFIGDVFGNPKSPLVHGFGLTSEGKIAVLLGSKYSYMDTANFEILDLWRPFLVKKIQHSSGGGRNLFGRLITGVRNMGRRFANFGRSFIGKPAKPLHTYGDSPYYTWEEIEIIEGGSPFKNGLARICLFEPESNHDTTSAIYVHGGTKLLYNFMDVNGKILNAEKYSIAYDFMDGKAFVKKDYDYYFLDTLGKETKADFSVLEKLENNYFMIKKSNGYGVLSPEYKIVAEPIHSYLELKGNNFVEIFHKDSIIYTIPEE